MTQANYLEVGKILNTHGVRGELKIQPWLDARTDYSQAAPNQLYCQRQVLHRPVSVRMQGAERCW